MIDRQESLIDPPSKQLTLSSIDLPAAVFAESEAKEGHYTGARLFAQKPETYQAIVSLLGEGLHVIRIARLLRVHPKTVRAVREREGNPIAQEKERLGRLAYDAARMSIERIVEDLDDEKASAEIPTDKLAVIAGIMTEKALLLTGGATSRVEHQGAANPEHDDFNRMLAEMGSRGRTLEQRADEATPVPGASRVIEAEPVANAEAHTEPDPQGETEISGSAGAVEDGAGALKARMDHTEASASTPPGALSDGTTVQKTEKGAECAGN